MKFAPKDGRVQIQLQRVRSHVEIVVSDTGQGIGSDVLPFVFDRLRQGDGGSAHGQGGLGIGLALVRHFVELHGGSVYAESPGEGQGATFVVKLPLMVAEMREQPIAHHDSPRLDSAVLAGTRIIVVDDDPTAVELITEVLVQAGGEVISCGTADDALQAFARSRPDVILSDIEMPGQDGYSLVRKLRALGPSRAARRPRGVDRVRPPGGQDPKPESGFNIHVSKPWIPPSWSPSSRACSGAPDDRAAASKARLTSPVRHGRLCAVPP